MASGGEKKSRTRRDYRPAVEGLEAKRLLSSATQAHPLPGMIAERDLLTDPLLEPTLPGEEPPASVVSNVAWDAALVQTHLADLLGHPETSLSSAVPEIAVSGMPSAQVPAGADSQAIAAGLTQLNKYLSRTWYRAGIPAQLHDDSTQAVYATLLQVMGRDQFDGLAGDVGHWGIREVFSRETSEGLTFFRAVDMVKKRMRREKVHQSLDAVEVPSDSGHRRDAATVRAVLQDAIDQSLSPREAALIQETLMGLTPAEIAARWGVAPKTISNEKYRALRKLREVLDPHEMN